MSVISHFQVSDYQELSGNILKIFLHTPSSFAYEAGQYVDFLLPAESPRSFSIANAPNHKTLEFHIRHTSDNLYSQKLVNYIKTYQKLTLTGPYGNLRYQTNPRLPLIFAAAGTGFAPCKAIIEQALKDPHHAPLYLYWGARKKPDLYFHSELINLSNKIINFYYKPVLSLGLESLENLYLVNTSDSDININSHRKTKDNKPAHKNLNKNKNKDKHKDKDDNKETAPAINLPSIKKARIYHEILKYHPDLSHAHIYASGPKEMVFEAQKYFSEKNLTLKYFYSDWLGYKI